MDQKIICPNCKQQIPLTEALSHEIREQFRNQAIEYKKKTDAEYKKKLEEQIAKFDDDRKNLQRELEENTRKKIEEEMRLKLELSAVEMQEQKKQIHDFQTQILDLTKSLRQSQAKEDELKIENEKKLLVEQEKIKLSVEKTLEDQYKFKLLEKEKQLEDTKRALDDAKRKTEQVSQQLQGEVLELEVERQLKAEFPLDEIMSVGKGIRGADIIQTVIDNRGNTAGVIIWELKRTKNWDREFISKLKEDQRQKKAEYAVIISEVLPPQVKMCEFVDGVWVGNFQSISLLSKLLRKTLLEVSFIKKSNSGKNGKMEELYDYIQGTEFKQRMEAIREAFSALQDSMEKEKRWFAAKWAKDEKNIRRILDNSIGMTGDLASITGKEITNLDGFDDTEMITDGLEDLQQDKLI